MSKVDQKEKINHFFMKYVKENGFDAIPTNKWRLPPLTIAQSYQEVAKFWEEKEVKLNENLWLLAQEIVYMRYLPFMRGTGQLSLNDVIREWDGASSPGFFYNVKYHSTRELLENQRMVTECSKWDDALQKGKPLPDIYVSSLKRQELRKVGKAPRTFMGSGKRMLAWKQVLYKSQNDAITRNHANLWIKVGMSNYYRGFHKLYTQIKQKAGKNSIFWDSDVSGWDRSVPEVLIRAVYRLRHRLWPNNMRNEKNHKRAEILLDLTINSFVLLEQGEVVKKKKGIPSGDGNTITDNSWGHELVVINGLLEMIPENVLNRMNLMEIMDLCYTLEMAFMGDDNIGGANLDKFPWFSLEKLQKTYEKFGFTLKQIHTSNKLEDLEFLSRTFIERKGCMLPLPNREKILCAMAYGNHGLHPKEMFQRALSMAQESWPDEKLYGFLIKYIGWFYESFRMELEEEDEDYPSWRELQAQMGVATNRDVLLRLYTQTREGSVDH